ncbi:hypothetical protein GOV05_03135 [Candidatus Woesearchaeota archaeon]|nr:hypothetical protein [Candidatus Woesearchaeota archaeon]
MKVFSNRRGVEELQLTPLLILIFIVIIFFFLFSYAKSISESTYLKRNFLAKDIGFTIEATKISPSNLVIDYPREIENAQISLTNSNLSVRVYDEEVLGRPAFFPTINLKGVFVEDFVYPEEQGLEDETYGLVIEKNQEEVLLKTK